MLLTGKIALTQDTRDDLISGDFHEASFTEFATAIESQTHFRFYYDDSLLDSVAITITFHKAHLASVLDSVFRNTDFYYTIYKKDFVFINKGFPFDEKLPYGFFSGKKDTSELVKKSRPPVKKIIRTEEPPQVNSDISIENKLFDIGIRRNEIPKGNVNVAGYIRDAQTGESLSGALIYLDHPRVQVNSDQFGYYSLTLPAGRHTLNIMAPGMTDTHRYVMLYSDGTLDINIDERVIKLKEVVIEAGKEKNVRSVTMGLNKITIQEIKQMPAVMGEADVLRTVLTLPGVKSVGEASTGLNVRGGASDQNLILFNGLNIYNPTHLFGFFSAFDPDLIKDVSLYKGNVPAKYGGRTSSVLDITSLDGNDKKLAGSAGVSLLTSKFTLEGPLGKKTTFVMGARATYSNWIFHNLPHEYKKSRASFQDITLHINHQLNRKNNIYINGYLSNDKFNLNSDTSYHYNNRNANIGWKHIFNNRFYGVLSAGVDHYDYKVTGYDNPVNAYWLIYKINQYKFNADFNYFLSNKHKITFGLNSLYYHINPGSFSPRGKQSLIIPDTLEAEQALESGIYFSDEFAINHKLSVEGGIRYSYYDYLGPKNVFTYAPGLPRQESTMTGTDYFPSRKTIKAYGGPEYRASARYVLSENTSIKAAYNTLRQYIHVVSNTTTVSPTDVWKLSDQNIKPEWSSQVSLGLYKNFQSNTIETSIEVYYKWIKNNIDYKSGAILIMNHHLETDVFNTTGKAYGIEFLLKKATGKLNGWVSYTFSRAFIRQDDPLAGEVINGGNYYPTSFDQPHSLSVIGNYRINHRFSVSMNVIYNTGRPITVPVGIIDYGNSARFLYSDRNEYRIPDYFRMDVSMNIEGNHKVKQLTHNSWNIGFYNLTGRKNAYSVYFISQNGDVHGYKLAIFGTIIPFVTYNIRF
jgi:outer membrane cobalamin receptor